MEAITSGGWVIPIVILLLAVGFLMALAYAASRYKKIPPGRVGIFYGRKYKWTDGSTHGFMVVTGGGRILMPLIENYLELPTTAFQVAISEEDIPNKDNVKMTVGGVATCKISSESSDLVKAIEALIDTLTDKRETRSGRSPIEDFVLNILKGHLRSIIGKLDINALLRERDSFNQQVVSESKVELKEFGIELKNLVIQDINDREGYIDALGRQAVADAKADAEIKVAEAKRNEDMKVSDAQREASLTKAANAGIVAEAEKNRDVKIAEYKKEADTKKAEADMALGIAQAGQEKTLRVAEADRDAAEKEAQIKVQTKEADRRKAELTATVVADANANQERSVIDAEGAKKTRIIQADAEAEYLTRTAQAKSNAAALEGEGEAKKQRSILIANAEGKAAEKREALLAEAEGTLKLAEALKDMDQSARFMIIMDKLPALLDSGGDAAAKVAEAIFSSVAAPLGNIDEIRIIDFGGGNGSGGMNQLSNVVPKTVFEVFARLNAVGIDPSKLMSVLGIDMSQAAKLLGSMGSGDNGAGGDKEAVAEPVISAEEEAKPESVAVPPAPTKKTESRHPEGG